MKHENTLSDISLNRIQKTPDIPNLVAGQIIERIARGILKPGDKLPSEFEMTKSFGISRLSLREAMKLLEAKGYIESQGRKGKFIQDSSEHQLETRIEGILHVDHKKIWELLAVRRIVDSEAARMAAEKATKAQIANLKNFHTDVDKIGIDNLLNVREGGKLYARFYSDLADATNNTIYAQLMKTISSIIRGALPYSRDKLQDVKSVGRIFYDHHIKIIETIESHDGKAAKQAVLDHLDWLEKTLKKILE
ncbi:MAG: hypothetical protein CVV44_10510 [Spirochaetae bacterium HGW-Spirochaetae-1]|jgi:GntR family transcriptional repressor for pyruvate dehydrogenase complex|nr:MAG: hypothetical protein CVV44_10510 [Spirochaetae bacterium HGW-Spirochaetae-1]